MTREDDVRKVKQILDDAKMMGKRVESQQRVDEENRKAKELREKSEAEARLRATGVVDLFESLRDEGVVKYIDKLVYEARDQVGFFRNKQVRIKVKDFVPAEVSIDDGSMSVSISFDRRWVDNKFQEDIYEVSQVSAYLKNGNLIVRGKEEIVVGGNLSMVDAVGMALAHPRFSSV